MEQSESIKELTMALSAAQGEMPAAPFNSVNPFLKNRFADLGSIIVTAQPVLSKHGLSMSQLPISENGNIGVTTQLMHSSGEWLRSTITLPASEEKGKSGAQVAGSIITYLRRYSYAAVLGMYAEEDDDGSQSKKTSQKTNPAKPASVTTEAMTPKEKWDAFLKERGISEEKALGALGTKSVGEWVNLNKGKNLNDAIVTIVAVMGLDQKAA